MLSGLSRIQLLSVIFILKNTTRIKKRTPRKYETNERLIPYVFTAVYSDATTSSFLSRHRNDISVVLCYNSADSCRQRVSPRETSHVDACGK